MRCERERADLLNWKRRHKQPHGLVAYFTENEKARTVRPEIGPRPRLCPYTTVHVVYACPLSRDTAHQPAPCPGPRTSLHHPFVTPAGSGTRVSATPPSLIEAVEFWVRGTAVSFMPHAPPSAAPPPCLHGSRSRRPAASLRPATHPPPHLSAPGTARTSSNIWHSQIKGPGIPALGSLVVLRSACSRTAYCIASFLR